MDLFDLDFRVIRGVCVLLLLHPITRWPDHPIKKQRPELAFRAFGFCVLLVSLLAEAGDQAGEE
ncbi:MAG TPA: hypothetical protein VJT08_21620 [Terriglobales bacterium]|nr:hypothetical protein [Terriglobales bacterium]